MGEHRSGFVTFVGRPNAGKSTLLNKILGHKVSIVSDKPQTTRTQVRGVLTRRSSHPVEQCMPPGGNTVQTNCWPTPTSDCPQIWFEVAPTSDHPGYWAHDCCWRCNKNGTAD